MLTWKFSAKDVRDAVWAASLEFQWDATSWKGIYAFANYRPSAAASWHGAADMSRLSIVASNERAYMWQDEALNTFINTFSEARRYASKGDQMARAAQERGTVEQVMLAGIEGPIVTTPDQIDQRLLGVSAYVKPSVELQLLRQEILDPEAFDDAFRTYIKRWTYKHPTPADFFRTMQDAGGRRPDWFWHGWFVENARYDQAVDAVVTQQDGITNGVAVAFGNRERGVLPVRARFTFSDGSTEDYNYTCGSVEYELRSICATVRVSRQDTGASRDRSGAADPGYHSREQRLKIARSGIIEASAALNHHLLALCSPNAEHWHAGSRACRSPHGHIDRRGFDGVSNATHLNKHAVGAF